VSGRALSSRRISALIVKECLQVLRDPSSLLIAFVLPPILLWLFSYAVSLDVDKVPFGVVLEGSGYEARQLAAAYAATPYFRTRVARDRRELDPLLVRGEIIGYAVIPPDFDEALLDPTRSPRVQVIADASSPNTANIVQGYARGVVDAWSRGGAGGAGGAIALQPRYWFNQELDGRHILTLGGIAIVMTLISTLLTALVIAREWERGTMEAMMSTPAGMVELLISKLAPYFLLGMLAALGCAAMSVFLFGVPFRGSVPALLLTSAFFLVPALGQGLLISTVARNQFVAAQISVFSAFVPATLLSGALFEIDSMPLWLQWLTELIPARHYVSSLQSIFLAGDPWPWLVRDMAGLLAVGALFFALTLLASRKSLD